MALHRRCLSNLAAQFSVLLLLSCFLVYRGAEGFEGAEGLVCEISFDNPDFTIVKTEANETLATVNGFFRVTEKSGVDTLLEATATLSISRSDWTTSLSRSTFTDVQKDEIYQFSVEVNIPGDAEPEESCTYTVTLVVSDQLGNAQAQASFTLTLEAPPDDDDDNGNGGTPLPQGDDSIPLWPIIFVLGIIALCAIAGFWAYRNLEMVREVDGSRRIYLRERDSGRILGKKGRSRGP